MTDLLWNEAQQLVFASSLAIALVLLLRPLLRRAFGPELAYLAWAAVPLSLLAVLLPQAGSLPPHPSATPSWTTQALAGMQSAVLQAPVDPRPALLLAWGFGALLLAAVLARTQWKFASQVRRRPGSEFDQSDEASPAVFGLWRPRIVLPGDFTARYDTREQALLLAHEREHIRRRDIPAQALAAALACVFWFNPLVHIAARRFRLDQELACDAAVLRRHPKDRRSYGEAMLKTQLAATSLPLGCHWPSRHPLKERITMLKQSSPSAARRRAGSAVIAAGLALVALGSWAAQPTQAPPADIPSLQVLTSDDVLGNPKYPASAARDGIGGLVVLDVLVGEDGSPDDVRVHLARPEGVFEQYAMEAARDWQFNAGREGRRGDKIEGWVRVQVKFTPDAPPSGDEPAPEPASDA
ncbi:MAG TPA: TonB family protein [Arenimonas sp.]